MKRIAGAATAALGLCATGAAPAAPAFYGTWSCALVTDNTVATDWTREIYSAAGVSVGPDGKTEPLKVRMIRKGVFDLGYPNGARARIAMQTPWMFVRGTMEHSYACLKTAP
jgi:hypothetical protein